MIAAVYRYRNRIQAGQILAQSLGSYRHRGEISVLAISASAVPIASEVARQLNAPLDVFLARKLELPEKPDVTLGAIATGGVRVLDDYAIREAGLAAEQVATVVVRETAELNRQQTLYRGERTTPKLEGRIAILIDDGSATGFSMHAAVVALHRQQPGWLAVAVPVAPPEVCGDLAEETHDVICPLRPSTFQAVGLWYDHFAPVTDEEVIDCLARAADLPRKQV